MFALFPQLRIFLHLSQNFFHNSRTSVSAFSLICAGEAFFILCDAAAAYNVIISFCAWPFNWRKLKRENIFATVPRVATVRGGTLCRRRWQSQLWQLIRKRDFIFIIIRPPQIETERWRKALKCLNIFITNLILFFSYLSVRSKGK